ncbi:MAG: hypothetical protein ACRDTN_08900, partial [Mycobacterium sp.]
MAAPAPSVEITVEGDDLVVTGRETLADRRCRLFFRSVIGATPTEDGWVCPRRHASLTEHIVRVNSFLERSGYAVRRQGVVDREVERELERRRSFDRTRRAATDFRDGVAALDLDVVKRELAAFGWSDRRELRPHQEAGLAHALTAIN